MSKSNSTNSNFRYEINNILHQDSPGSSSQGKQRQETKGDEVIIKETFDTRHNDYNMVSTSYIITNKFISLLMS